MLAEFGGEIAVRNHRHDAGQIAIERGQQARRIRPEREADHSDTRGLLILSKPGEQAAEIPHRLAQAEHVVDRIDVGHEHLVEAEPRSSAPVEREYGQGHVHPELQVQTARVRVLDVAQATHVLTVDPDEPRSRPPIVAQDGDVGVAVRLERPPTLGAGFVGSRRPATREPHQLDRSAAVSLRDHVHVGRRRRFGEVSARVVEPAVRLVIAHGLVEFGD